MESAESDVSLLNLLIYIQLYMLVIPLVLTQIIRQATSLLSISYVRTSFGIRSFSIAAPAVWNHFPPAFRMCTRLDTFRYHIKTSRPSSCVSDLASDKLCELYKLYLLTYLLSLVYSCVQLVAFSNQRTIAKIYCSVVRLLPKKLFNLLPITTLLSKQRSLSTLLKESFDLQCSIRHVASTRCWW